MKVKKSLLLKFNNKETILVISGYPERKSNGDTTHGIAWYTQRSLRRLADRYGLRFVVLVEKGRDNRPQLDGDGKILVLRVFDKKRPSLFPQILCWLVRFSRIRKSVVHSEFCADGGVGNFLLLLPFLGLIKLFGKEIVFFAHNVVDDFSGIGEHLNLKRNGLKMKLYNFGVKVYNCSLGVICHKIVVLNQVLRERLSRYVNSEKIVCLPIPIEKVKSRMSKRAARNKLGIKNQEKVILYFGFVSWYKGADWLVREFDSLIKKYNGGKIRLIMAGGKAYSLKQKRYYQEYFRNLNELSKSNFQIDLTGFVEEKNICLYFKAVDLVVLPYRELIGASGSFNQALRFQKPFLLSRKMTGILDERQMNILKSSGLSLGEITFNHSKQGMEKILSTVLNDKNLARIEDVSQQLAAIGRSGDLVEREYEAIYRVEELSEIRDILKIKSNLAKGTN